MSEKRKLSTVFFADIAGYTSLMQTNEKKAMLFLKYFKAIIEKIVPIHQGEIIQYYGDAVLLTFDSSKEGVECSITLQKAFIKEKIPVRIGMHLGDVIFKNDNVFGDGVNIASRIESMGIPGSILVSKVIYSQLSNKSEFQLSALGSFEFKNVEEPIDVFAIANEGIAIPLRHELKGKLKTKPNRKRVLAYFLPFILILAAGAYWFSFGSKNKLPDDVQSARIAVLPYENKTNEPDLDVLGEMASDWIIQGMMNYDELKVVSYQTIKVNLPYLHAPDGLSFQERTGTEKIIRGSYYQDGAHLIFQSQIIDAASGDIEFAFPEVMGSAANTSQLVKDLRDVILTYFSIQESLGGSRSSVMLERPPKLEAFQYYDQHWEYFGIDYNKSIALLNKAIEADSSFFWPYPQIFFAYNNQGKYEEADSVLAIVDQKFERFTAYEQAFFDFIHATADGDLLGRQKHMLKVFEKDPKNIYTNYMTALTATNLNQPNKAIEYFSQIPPSSVQIINKVYTWWRSVYAFNLIKTNQLDKAMEIVNLVPDEKASNGIFYRKQEVYVLRNQSDSLLQMIYDLEQKHYPPSLINGLYTESVKKFALQGNIEQQNYWALLAIERIANLPESIDLDKARLAAAYFYNEQYDEALPIYLELVNRPNPSAYNLRRLAGCYAYLGLKDDALNIMQQIQSIDEGRMRDSGEYVYATAAVYAMLGEKDKAVQYLKKAFKDGYRFNTGTYQYAVEFLPLKGYAPYEEFVALKK